MSRLGSAAGFAAAILVLAVAGGANAQQSNMTFFVTSAAPGSGDLGGLAGADATCQKLAAAAGAGGHTWHAYLSARAADGKPAVNARDRIGAGPWQNAKGVMIATSVDDLHSANNKINKQTALTETGGVVNGFGDKPNQHDMLTGSQPDGRVVAGDADLTCKNWTSSSEGKAMVGHSDITGPQDTPPMHSWNSSHPTPDCSPPSIQRVGGSGRFYCFAER